MRVAGAPAVNDGPALRAALACAAGPGRGAQVAVVPFDADRYLANVALRVEIKYSIRLQCARN